MHQSWEDNKNYYIIIYNEMNPNEQNIRYNFKTKLFIAFFTIVISVYVPILGQSVPTADARLDKT